MSLLADLERAMAGAEPPRRSLPRDVMADFAAALGPVALRRANATPQRRAVVPPDDQPRQSQAELRRALAVRAKVTAGQGDRVERAPWPDRWWGAFDSADAAACRALWGEALRLLLIDAFRDVAGTSRASVSWVGGRDFHMMAALAGLDGTALADRLAPALKDPARAEQMVMRLRVGVPIFEGQA